MGPNKGKIVKDNSFNKVIKNKVIHFLYFNRERMIFIVAFLLFIMFSIILRGKGFLSFFNILNILRQTAIVSIIAVGFVFVVTSGQIDLSLGSIFGLSSLILAIILQHFGIVPAVILALVVGVIVGLANAFFVVKVQIPAFLVTLSTMLIVKGVARWISISAIPVTNKKFTFIFGGGDVLGVPVLFIWTIGIMAIFHVLLKKTTFGRYILACGQNRVAAKFAGINVNKIRFLAYTISGGLAALAGILMAGRLSAARYDYGEGEIIFTVIAAAVIGGTSIYGGRGTIIGAIIGSIIIGMINNGLILCGFDITQQMLFRGVIIIIAIMLGSRERSEN